MRRNLLLDNAKLLMIFLVIVGHMIEPIVDQSILYNTTFKFIYSFHMPVFVFIAGLLTKQNTIKDNNKKLLKSIFIPLLAFTLLFEIPELIFKGSLSHYTTSLAPYWILWFLASLLVWKIVAPYFIKLRYPLLISIAIALISGYFDSIGYFLGLSRTIYFFPFFIIGYKLSPKHLSSTIISKIPKVIPIGILLLNLAFFYTLPEISYHWLFGSFSYSELGASEWYASIYRLFFLSLSFISGAAILLLIPNKNTFYTIQGSRSLYIYLWHGLFIKALTISGLITILNNGLPNSIVLTSLVLLAGVVTYICSLEVIERLTNRLLFKPLSKLLLK